MKNPTPVDRLSKLKTLMRRQHCTHILLSDSVDCEYLTGFRSSHIFLLVSARHHVLLTDFRYRNAALRFCRHSPKWRFVEAVEGGFGSLRKLLPAGSVVGYQSNMLTVDQFSKLKRACRGTRFVALSDTVSGIFVRKEDGEMRSMRRAAGIGDRAWAATLGRIKVGMTEREVVRCLDGLCREHGSEKNSFDTIVLFGSRTALPHGVPSGKRLRREEWILADFGCTIDGFCSDMTRTCVAGNATDRQRQVYGIVQTAQSRARKAVRTGANVADIDRSARSVIEKAGYGESFGHATGHGVGRRIHEAPRVSHRADDKLGEGTVITIEPGIYIAGFGGVRIEDMVAVTRNGPRLLTHSPRHLMEIAA